MVTLVELPLFTEQITSLVDDAVYRLFQKDLLGHGSLATTERYLRLTITDLKEAHAKFHPREKS